MNEYQRYTYNHLACRKKINFLLVDLRAYGSKFPYEYCDDHIPIYETILGRYQRLSIDEFETMKLIES
jgi:hypothetical protein